MSNSFELYLTHFSRWGEKFSRGVSPPHGYGPGWETGALQQNFCWAAKDDKLSIFYAICLQLRHLRHTPRQGFLNYGSRPQMGLRNIVLFWSRETN